MSDLIPNDQAGKIRFLDQLDKEASEWRNLWDKNWEKDIRVCRGELWPDKNTTPLFLANLISPTIERKSGLLTESKPIIDVMVRRPGLKETAQILKKTISALWDECNMEMQLESLASFLGAIGNGFFKIVWDKTADYGLGNIVITAVDPRCMRVDPSNKYSWTIDKCQYLIEESIVPLSWIHENFEETGMEVRPDSRLSITGGQEKKLSWLRRTIIHTFGEEQEQDAIPRVWLRQYWVRDPASNGDGGMKYPNGRMIFRTGDDTILNPDYNGPDPYNDKNPYYDGLWPYQMLDNKPDLDHPFGRSEAESLRKINEAFNRSGHALVRSLIRNVPWTVADANAISPETITDIKELEEVVIEKAAGRNVQRIPPAIQAGSTLDTLKMLIGLTQMLGGVDDGGIQSKGRVELRSAPQLEGLQQAAQVLVRSQARRLEAFLERVGMQLISRVFQFYTNDRLLAYAEQGNIKQYEFQKDALRKEVIQIATDAAQQKLDEQHADSKAKLINLPTTASLDPKEIQEVIKGAWKLFRFKIVPLSSLASTKLQRTMVLEQLVEQGQLPARIAMENAGFDNYKELLMEVAAEQKFKQSLGFPPPQPSGGSKSKSKTKK